LSVVGVPVAGMPVARGRAAGFKCAATWVMGGLDDMRGSVAWAQREAMSSFEVMTYCPP